MNISTDLNPIENLWADFKSDRTSRRPQSDKLGALIRNKWININQERKAQSFNVYVLYTVKMPNNGRITNKLKAYKVSENI